MKICSICTSEEQQKPVPDSGTALQPVEL